MKNLIYCTSATEDSTLTISQRRKKIEEIAYLPNQHAENSEIALVRFQSPYFVRLSDDDNYTYNNKFSLRFYMPKKRASSIFFLVNGFGEAVASVWDKLGSTFARSGVASVLIPLPHHYCRSTFFNVNDYSADSFWLNSKKDRVRYTNSLKFGFLRRPELLVEFDKQIMADVAELVQEVLTRRDHSQMSDFLGNHLSPAPKISILGFSLGGLVALQAFLAHPNIFNSCVLINSGASFQDMNASQVFREDWRALQRGILERTRNLSRPEMASNFDRVFLGHEKVALHDLLIANKNKILVLLGGSDPIFNAGNIANILPQETGLAVFQIPSLTHFINIRSMGGDIWDEWSNFTARMILSFDRFRPQGD